MKISFPNSEYFEDVNREYSDFFQKSMAVIDNVAQCKTKRVKGNIQSSLMQKYMQNVVQGTNSLKNLRKRGCILIKKYIKRLNTMHKS